VIYTPPEEEDRLRRLLAVTSDGAWELWLLFMLEAVEETAAWTTAKIGAVRDLVRRTVEWVREKLFVHDKLLALLTSEGHGRARYGERYGSLA